MSRSSSALLSAQKYTAMQALLERSVRPVLSDSDYEPPL
jgi:hypothetical protein